MQGLLRGQLQQFAGSRCVITNRGAPLVDAVPPSAQRVLAVPVKRQVSAPQQPRIES